MGMKLSVESQMMKVLIVDDDLEFAANAHSAITIAGHEVEVARDGDQAIAAQRRFHADTVILDVFMPVADGFETLWAIRNEFPPTRFIIATSGTKIAPSHYMRAAEFMDVEFTMLKPIEMPRLVERLARIERSLSATPDCAT
jgi:CheY-like chemotaxis protein